MKQTACVNSVLSKWWPQTPVPCIPCTQIPCDICLTIKYLKGWDKNENRCFITLFTLTDQLENTALECSFGCSWHQGRSTGPAGSLTEAGAGGQRLTMLQAWCRSSLWGLSLFGFLLFIFLFCFVLVHLFCLFSILDKLWNETIPGQYYIPGKCQNEKWSPLKFFFSRQNKLPYSETSSLLHPVTFHPCSATVQFLINDASCKELCSGSALGLDCD